MYPFEESENNKLISSLSKYFPGFQLAGGERILNNSGNIISLDFILTNQTYSFSYKNRKGEDRSSVLYLADLEKMLDINHREYWGLFPRSVRSPGGQAALPAYKDFITIARAKLREKKPFNVFEFFLSAIEREIKEELGYDGRWEPYLPAFLHDNITERFLRSTATAKSKGSNVDRASNICHLDYIDNGVKIVWDFSGVIRHDQDADIYKAFSRYCYRHILLCAFGYDITNYLGGKTLIVPANEAKYKHCIDSYNKENPKRTFDSIKTFYEKGYNLVIYFLSVIYLLSIEKNDDFFTDIVNYVLEISHEKESDNDERSGSDKRSAIDGVINRAVSHALEAAAAVTANGQTIPDLDKIQRSYNARAKPEIKRMKVLQKKGRKIGDDSGVPATVASLRIYKAAVRKAYESLFNIIIAGYAFRLILFPNGNTGDDIFSRVLSVTCMLGDTIRKPRDGILKNFITGNWYDKPEVYALAKKAWKAAGRESFMTPAQIKDTLDKYADSGSYKNFEKETGDLSSGNRVNISTPLSAKDEKGLKECIDMLVSLVGNEDEKKLTKCVAMLVPLQENKKRHYRAAFKLLKELDLKKILETAEVIFSMLFEIRNMSETGLPDYHKIIPCVLSKKERETLRIALIQTTSIEQPAYRDDEKTNLEDTILSGNPNPKPEEEFLDRTEAEQIKPFIIKYLRLEFWESKFKEFRKYLNRMDASDLKGLIVLCFDKNRENVLFKDLRRLADTGMTEDEEDEFKNKIKNVALASVNDYKEGAYTGKDNPYFLSDEELEQPEYIGQIRDCVVSYSQVIFPGDSYKTFRDYLEKRDALLLMDMVMDFTRPWARHKENDLVKECKCFDPPVDEKECIEKMKLIAKRALTDAKEFFYNNDRLKVRRKFVLARLKDNLTEHYENLNIKFLEEKELSELYLLMAPFGLKGHYYFNNLLYVQALGNIEDKEKYDLFRKRLNKIGKELYREQGDRI
jgi:hypothetical protein